MVGKDRDFDEEYAEALACKQKGNEQFVTGNYSHANFHYEEGIQRMEHIHESIKSGQDEIEEDKDEISISHSELLQSISSELSKMYSNDAECSLRMKQYFLVVTQADNSLKWDETNFKSNFRRAKANVELANYSKAQEDLTYLRSKSSSSQSLKEIEKLESEIQRRYDFLYRLIDSYRLRVEDEYLQTGDVELDTLYSGTCPMPLRHFRAYVRMAMAKAATRSDVNILPSWFDDMNGNNFKITSEIAETHEHYSIRFAQEPSDIMKHYNALGKPNELKELRKLAVKIKGPIFRTGWNCDDEEEGIDIRDYYSAHESDIDDEGNWWQDAPYSPFEDDDDEGWGSKFPRFDPTTLDIDESGDGSSTSSSSQHQHEESDSDKLVEILLKRKYGEKANGLESLSFCKIVEDHQLIHTKYVDIPQSMIKDHDTSNPKGKFFDHYGLVAALAVVAFKLLPEEERNSAIIQKRLVDAVYGGEEDILTYHYAYESNVQSMEEWDGPEKGLTISGVVKSWNEGEGCHLMQKAWDVWYSLVRARELLAQLKKQEVDFNSTENDDICLLANEALSLPCFSDEALMQLNSCYSRRLSWDSGLNVFGLYAELALLASKAHLKLGNYREALEIALRPFQNASSLYQYKQVSKRLRICQAKAHVGLKQYRDAEECLEHVVGTYATNKNELPSEEVKKVEMLVEEIKGKRGPFPERQPTAIQGKEGWWYFDASCDVVARNYLMPRQDLTIKVWKQSYPMITKIEIKIEGLYSICGMKDMFPNLRALIVDDSKNGLRIGYHLEELKSYSETLELLRLNLSGQWMEEGSESFAEILSQLTQLKTLSVSHIRDGRDKDLKALEKLTYLESLTYSAGNMSWYEYSENGHKGAGTLDLSELTELKSCEFISCMFCAKSEEGQDAQVLILPKQLREITFVYDYRKPSDVLLDELKSMGVTVKCMSSFDWH